MSGQLLKGETLKEIKGMRAREVREYLASRDIPYYSVTFSGQKKGGGELLSHSLSYYKTHGWGYLDNFYRCLLSVGEVVADGGHQGWTVVKNTFVRGDAETPSVHTLILANLQ